MPCALIINTLTDVGCKLLFKVVSIFFVYENSKNLPIIQKGTKKTIIMSDRFPISTPIVFVHARLEIVRLIMYIV